MKYRNERDHRPKKSLGQNFLSDPNFIDKIVKAVDPGPGQVLFEIGPGRGALTERFAPSGAEVIALELDRDLVPFLRVKFADFPNVRILEQDALKADLEDILGKELPGDLRPNGAKLAANLPYYISTAILQRLAAERSIFTELVLMFQREVVDRITAPPHDSERGFLTVFMENAFTVERLFDVPPQAFRPVPKVWSSVARFKPKPFLPAEDKFRDLVSAGFLQKRKTISNNLRTKFPAIQTALETAEISQKSRAEELSLDDWLRLHTALESIRF